MLEFRPVRALRKNARGKKAQLAARRRPPVNSAQLAARARSLAEPVCQSAGLELVHVEYQRETGGRILRLYIDKAGGVTLADCAAVSRQLNDLLDVYLPDSGPYSLEVTSPGPDRPLAREKDFERFKGQTARIKTVRPLEGQKNFKGVLLGISAGQVQLKAGDRTVAIALEDIYRARLVNYNGES